MFTLCLFANVLMVVLLVGRGGGGGGGWGVSAGMALLNAKQRNTETNDRNPRTVFCVLNRGSSRQDFFEAHLPGSEYG